MTQTPNETDTGTDEQTQLLDEIAADATAYARDYFSQPPVGGAWGERLDAQARAWARLAVTAEAASAKLEAIQSGTHGRGRGEA